MFKCGIPVDTLSDVLLIRLGVIRRYHVASLVSKLLNSPRRDFVWLLTGYPGRVYLDLMRFSRRFAFSLRVIDNGASAIITTTLT
jgi:hypothetical protein